MAASTCWRTLVPASSAATRDGRDQTQPRPDSTIDLVVLLGRTVFDGRQVATPDCLRSNQRLLSLLPAQIGLSATFRNFGDPPIEEIFSISQFQILTATSTWLHRQHCPTGNAPSGTAHSLVMR